MLLVLPDPATVKAPTNPTASVGAPRTVDNAKEYRVSEGDNLYRISVKLYGKPDHTEKLYEWNKHTIGPNPEKLKVGMILKLEDPPSASASAR